ncbi:LexA family protein [Streptomyces caeruleatus]|uniref:LexA repressor DNA-binding domain-containing protein n=1 Tax=Streptomyces caeruleatus TaxID=661399 RepID=A0A124IA77_9ACTN|nr:hypothetical protein [Streptomyces caeruleatus]KUO04806.1 hypothetical protein AQJ67_09865 [Streptomyces caeruleatus]
MTNDVLLVADGSAPEATDDTATRHTTAPPELTERQRRIIAFIGDATKEQGYPPSLREIGDAAGLTSTSSVTRQLSLLQKMGLIAYDAGRSRSYRIVADPPAAPAPSIPAPGHAECCPQQIGVSDGEEPIVLRVVLDPPHRQALLDGALVTVQRLPVVDAHTSTFPGRAVFGQVTAVAYPVDSPHP